MTRLAHILLEAGTHWPDPNYHLSAAAEQEVADRLAVPETFNFLGLELLKAVIGPASPELLDLLWQRTKRVSGEWHEMEVLMLWLGALMHRDQPMIAAMQTELRPYFTHLQSYASAQEFAPNWQYGVAVARWIKEPTLANADQVEKLISTLYAMGIETDAQWFTMMFARTKASQVQHNPALVDHPLTYTVAATPGDVIRFRRQEMGMRQKDLAAIVSPAALHRFETGQTQLSFGNLMRLCGTLALLPSQILERVTPPAGPKPLSLNEAFRRIQYRPLAAKTDPQQVITTFATQLPGIPSRILDQELFILKVAANQPDDAAGKMRQMAAQSFNQLMQVNHWEAMEMYSVQALVNWLDPAQLALVFNKGWRLMKLHPELIGGVHYCIGFCQAVRRVVTEFPSQAEEFIAQFTWLEDDPKRELLIATPYGWQMLGACLFAAYSLAPSAKRRAKCEQFVHRALRVGQGNIVTTLGHDWHALLPEGFLPRLIQSYQRSSCVGQASRAL
ncbi:helix-turn-helix domain-containing protein [Lacticaseibacillus camelliae]|uniref:helix-turn-helix domain-containing protein n=1 Tax=Lacticaseibacillus camelliae TaxID=381742 RepID=UPI0006D04751|nr:helix-turn-helix transcriptional regulator [Lacticaseibacillus camelliae]